MQKLADTVEKYSAVELYSRLSLVDRLKIKIKTICSVEVREIAA